MIFIVLHKNREGVSGTESPRSGTTAPQPRIFGIDCSWQKIFFVNYAIY